MGTEPGLREGLVKKVFLIVFLSTLLVAVAFGAATKVKFWHMYLSGPSKDVMDEIIAEFIETHKGMIEVEDLCNILLGLLGQNQGSDGCQTGT